MLWFCHHHHLGKFPFQGKVYDCDTFVSMRNHSDLSQERCVTGVSLHKDSGLKNPQKKCNLQKPHYLYHFSMCASLHSALVSKIDLLLSNKIKC